MQELRAEHKNNIKGIIEDKIEKVDNSILNFIYSNYEQEKNISKNKWNKELGNFRLIPHDLVKYIHDNLEDEQKNFLKYIIADISATIMETNIAIWKYRCKRLYSGNATGT